MNQDKKTMYRLSVLYPCVLLLACFVADDTEGKIILAGISVLFSATVFLLIKKRSIYGIEKKQAALVMLTVAVISITVYYLTGISFGFYKVLLLPSFIWKYIIPYAVIIVSSELTRSVLLAQKNRIVTVLSYISFVILDVAMLSQSNVFGRYDRFVDTVAMVLFPALTANLLYCYMSSKYGMLPNVLYRSLILIYPYLIPFKPKMPDAMLAFARIVMPLAIYLLIHSMYRRRKFVVSKRRSRTQIFVILLIIILMAACMMLISCQFRYCMIVIGSESMTGEINKGDALIYETYDDQIIQTGQVVVFIKNDTTVIHRVVDIKKINGTVRYYTKGDANVSEDAGYITDENIIGVAKMKIKFIGYPTIWVRSLFK